ncbi:MAG TPA: CapA family protein [Polyangiaceae bacterium]|jgi:poly-gamma-glutamate capsule biosynthesis protein CapA/YwtB (metallophosphatase superfamily)|nr:CapA family protein [Polyangiaceae bacterium]
MALGRAVRRLASSGWQVELARVRGLLVVGLASISGACLRPSVSSARTPAPKPAASSEASPIPPLVASNTGVESSFLLAAAGDVNLGRNCGQRLLADSSYDPFRRVASLWADADVRFVNLESGLSEQRGETQSPHHGLVFTGPPVGADALLRSGIGVVSTANNHAWDYARRGLFETLTNLDRVGVAHAGTGRDQDAAYRPAIMRVSGFSVAFFAVTQVWNLGVFAEEEAHEHVAWADFTRLRDALVRARAQYDFVVLSYHGGEEYLELPLQKTRDFVDQVMSLGVDLVIGHHPHVPQGVAWYGARPVFYSLGNFVFDSRAELPWTSSSFIAKVRFRRGRQVEVWACPYRIDGFEPAALAAGDVMREHAFEQHLRVTSARLGGTELGEHDALGCVELRPPVPVATTARARLSRDLPRADRESVRLDPR